MKKLLTLFAILTFFFTACESEIKEKTFNIINNSSYTLTGINFISTDFGTLTSGQSSVRKFSEFETGGWSIEFYIINDTDSYYCMTVNRIYLNNDNNEYIFNNNSVVIFNPYSGNSSTDTLTNIAGPLKTAVLQLSNMSDYNLLNVEFDSVDFGNINSGSNSNKSVSAGTKFIFFNLQKGNVNVRCRTEAITSVDNNTTPFIFTNNTIITVTGTGESGTLKNIYNGLN